MANFDTLKADIQANIKTNGNQEITGAVLQDTLLDMVEKVDYSIDPSNFIILGIGTSGIDSGVTQIGDVYYNASYNKLRKAIAVTDSGFSYTNIEWVINGIYYMNGMRYVWNGESLNMIGNEIAVEEVVNMKDAEYTVIENSVISSSTPAESTLYNRSSPIFLQKGETIITDSIGASMWVLSLTDVEGTNFTKLVEANSSTFKRYKYTAEEDCYICVCWRKVNFYKPLAIKIITNNKVNDLENDLNNNIAIINQDINNVKDSLLIKEEIDLLSYPILDYIILENGLWGTGDYYKHIIVPVQVGDKYELTSRADHVCRYAFLTDDAVIPDRAASLVEGTSRVEVAESATVQITIPNTCNYLYIQSGRTDTGTGYEFLPIKFEQVESRYIDKYLNKEIDLSSYPILDYIILESGIWGTGDYYKHIIVPVQVGDEYELTSRADHVCRYAFLTDDAVIPDRAASLVEGTSRVEVAESATVQITIPNTCNYLYIQSGRTDTGTGYEFLPAVFTQQVNLINVINSSVNRETRDVVIQMELGFLSSNGSSATSVSQQRLETNLSNIRSSLYYRVEEEDVINSINLEEDETCYIFMFDKNCQFIGKATFIGNAMQIPQGVSFVKFMCEKNENYTYTPSLSINVSKVGEDDFLKNSTPLNQINYYVFEVKKPLDKNNDINTASYQGETVRIWDSCYLYLPYNYNARGKNVPLVLFCHGTGGYGFSGGPSYTELFPIFSRNGFAVADCSGITSLYGTDFYGSKVDDLADSKSNPLLYSCYSALVAWLQQNFNIGDVFICSKSAGGLVANYLAYYAPFKIKAVASLAPALLMAGQSFRITRSMVSLNFWLSRLGYESPDMTYKLTDANKQYILANYKNLLGLDAFFVGTDIDYLSTLQKMYAIETLEDPSYSDQINLWNAYFANEELMAIFDAAKKYLPVPFKFWVAQDDASIPYGWVQKFVEMVNRGSGQCYLRTLPNGTGGHHATDTADTSIKTDYQCDDGTIMTIPIAFAESVDWFKQWV